jgi:DNA polymerase-3 subunit epsilon
MPDWTDARLLGFDLETTSVDPEAARVVSVACVAVGGGLETDGWHEIVDPGVEIPEEATGVHGITTERARAEGLPLVVVLPRILASFREAQAGGWPVVMHNARYDLTVLDRELRRGGMAEQAAIVEEVLVVDPIIIDRHLDRYRPKRVASHSLEDACRVWNAPLDGVHDATFDALAACRLAWRLCRSGRVIRRARNSAERYELEGLEADWDRVRGDLVALYAWQREVAAADAERLEAYFRAGDPRKDVPAQPDRVVLREWPVVPFRDEVPSA